MLAQVRLTPLVVGLVALALPVAAETLHVGYPVPPGSESTIFLEVAPATAPLEDVWFSIGGPATIQVTRVVGGTNLDPDVWFDDATPHDATRFFVDNHIVSTGSTQFYVVVDNQGHRDAQVSVTIHYD